MFDSWVILAVAEGALRGAAVRPMILKRFVKGIAHEAVFQKRAPPNRPEWRRTALPRGPRRRGRGDSPAATAHHSQKLASRRGKFWTTRLHLDGM
jgi:DNA primase